uniref:hypothetical protein n=1 Tax=Gemmiger formicilis TaxID=745368 RepID=UPI004027DEF0
RSKTAAGDKNQQMRNKNSRIISSNTKYCPALINNTLTTCACYGMIQVQKSDCRKTLVGASIARPCPFALQKNCPGKCVAAVSWRATNGRPYARNKARMQFIDGLRSFLICFRQHR